MTSIKDIATEAGVSIGTVDRVLHKRGRVSARTRVRVERIAAKLAYKPNIYARNLSLAKTFRFGVVMPRLDQDSGYWRIPAHGIERAHKQLGPARVRVLYFHFDRYAEASFEAVFRKAVAARLDGLLIAPVLPTIAEKLVAIVPETIPYALFDSSLPRTRALTTIGQDAFQSGVLAARLTAMACTKNGTIAVVSVTPVDFHISERLRGFLSLAGLSSSPRIVRYEADSHGGERVFESVARRILGENKYLQGIFVSNAWTHPFARYVKRHASSRKICLIGYDLVADNRACLEEGSIDFLISQRPSMQGYEGISALYRNVVLRDNVKQSIAVPLDIITKENVRFYQD